MNKMTKREMVGVSIFGILIVLLGSAVGLQSTALSSARQDVSILQSDNTNLREHIKDQAQEIIDQQVTITQACEIVLLPVFDLGEDLRYAQWWYDTSCDDPDRS